VAKLAEERDHWFDMSRIRLAEADQLREELARLHRLAPTGTYTVSLPHEQEIQALRDSRDKWAETARKLGEQLDSSERDAERLSALLDDCRDHIMSQYDPEDSVKLVRRIEEALGLGEPV
jgi:hypothetical protein